MKLRISGSRGHREINLPVRDAELAHLGKLIGDGTENPRYRLEHVWEEQNPLQKLIGQNVSMDEVNFFAKGWRASRHMNRACWKPMRPNRGWRL